MSKRLWIILGVVLAAVVAAAVIFNVATINNAKDAERKAYYEACLSAAGYEPDPGYVVEACLPEE